MPNVHEYNSDYGDPWWREPEPPSRREWPGWRTIALALAILVPIGARILVALWRKYGIIA